MKAILKRGSFPQGNIEIEVGGSKSESNRLLVLQSFFPDISLSNLSNSDDTIVLGKGLKTNTGTVDVHHAGTAMRFLTAYFAAKEGVEIVLTGSRRMQERPIRILVDALTALGADIEYLNDFGFPPLKIRGKKFSNSVVAIDAQVSSQYISALMLIAPSLPKGLQIHLKGKVTSAPYVEMTLSLLRKIGVTAKFSKNIIDIGPCNQIPHIEVTIESDWSSASYFYSLVALSENLEIKLSSFFQNSIQGDSALSSIFGALGVETKFIASENKNSILLSKENVNLPDSLFLDLSDMPDLAQTIAVTCFGLGIGCTLHGLHTLKIKETNRLVALQRELQKCGAKIQIGNSALQLEKSTGLNSDVSIKTYQDHRMAMAFAPLVLKTDIVIDDPDVVTKSYPSFWKDIKKLGISCVLAD